MTNAIQNFLDKRLKKLEKFVGKDSSAQGQVEIGTITTGQNSGEIFRAEINLHLAGQDFRSESTNEQLYSAIDEAQKEMARQVKAYKKRKREFERRGASRFKKLLTRFRGGDT